MPRVARSLCSHRVPHLRELLQGWELSGRCQDVSLVLLFNSSGSVDQKSPPALYGEWNGVILVSKLASPPKPLGFGCAVVSVMLVSDTAAALW